MSIEIAQKYGVGITYKGDDGTLYFKDEAGNVTSLVQFDQLAKVSSNDTTAGYLNGKLVAGSGVTLTENNNGANETLTISTVAGTDELLKVSSNDTTAGYLEGKLVAGSNVTLTTNNEGGNETITIASAGGVDTDEKTKVSANDTTAGYLNGKLVAGTGVTLTEGSDGGNETLTIASTVTDQLVKARSTDTTANYLALKLSEGAGIGFNILNSGANEQIQIISAQNVKVSSNDTTGGFLNGKIVAGSGITLTENNNGSNETLTIASSVTNTDMLAKVSSNDTTAGYLNGKLVAGSGITLTEGSDGGNETLTIAASGGGGGGGSDDTDLNVTQTDVTGFGGYFLEVDVPNTIAEGDMIIVDHGFIYRNANPGTGDDAFITYLEHPTAGFPSDIATNNKLPAPTSTSNDTQHFMRHVLIVARENPGSGSYVVWSTNQGSITSPYTASNGVYATVSQIGINSATRHNLVQNVYDWRIGFKFRVKMFFDYGGASYVYPFFAKAILRKGGETA